MELNKLTEQEKAVMVIVFYLNKLEELEILENAGVGFKEDGLATATEVVNSGFKVESEEIAKILMATGMMPDFETFVTMCSMIEDMQNIGIEEFKKKIDGLKTALKAADESETAEKSENSDKSEDNDK